MYIIANGTTYPGVGMAVTEDSVIFIGKSLPEAQAVMGEIKAYANNGFEMRAFAASDYARKELKSGSWLLTNAQEVQPTAQPVEYGLDVSVANAVRLLMKNEKPTTADEIIQCSAVYDEWKAGNHAVGEIFLVDGEPWTCFQAYDNAVYPDIAPGESAWGTFNKPYHGTTRQTARNFVHPTGAHDIYKAGEWAVQGGKFTKCISDTAYSLEEYAAAWEVEE
nr:MAG TPA: hypothetical protein [Caudoviricetes sp.]